MQKHQETKDKKHVKWMQMFSLEHVKSSFSVVFKRRPDGSRHFVAMLVLLFGLHSLASNGVQSITTPYIKQHFAWSDDITLNNWLATFGSIGTVLSAIGIGLILPLLSQVLKFNDMVITQICLVSFLGGLMITLSAKVPWVLYIAAGVQMFAMLTTTAIRAALTKIVSSDDTGKVIMP